jgi:hypothetical protein
VTECVVSDESLQARQRVGGNTISEKLDVNLPTRFQQGHQESGSKCVRRNCVFSIRAQSPPEEESLANEPSTRLGSEHTGVFIESELLGERLEEHELPRQSTVTCYPGEGKLSTARLAGVIDQENASELRGSGLRCH